MTEIKTGLNQAKWVLYSTRVLGLALLLALAGCFRPSAETLEPTANPNAQVAPEATSETDPGVGGDNLPAITLLAPETSIPATDVAPTDAPTNDTSGGVALTLVSPQPPTVTPLPTLAQAQALGEPTTTLQIITPGIGLPVTPDTATPLPSRTPTLSAAARALTATADPDATEEIAVGGLSADGCIYIIEAGDTLFDIAINYDVTVADLEEANPGVDSTTLQIGQEITLPACVEELAQIAPTDTPDPEETVEALPPGGQLYTVQAGDVLGAIAARFGVTVNAIVRANNLSNPDALSIGQRLIIPPPATPEDG